MAGADLAVPLQASFPFARGTSSEYTSAFSISGRVGRRVTKDLMVGGMLGYRFGRARHAFDAEPASLIEDKVTILSAGPFVRYEHNFGSLSALGEFVAEGGVLVLGGSTVGLPYWEISQNFTGYAFAATPRAGFAFEPVGRLHVELLVGYRVGFAASHVLVGQQQPPGTYFYTRRDHVADLYGGLEIAVGARYGWNAPPPSPAPTPSPPPSSRSAIYIEAGGTCVFYSINYEYDFDSAPGGLRARIGGSVVPNIPGGGGGFILGTLALNLVAPGDARSLVPEGGAGFVFGPGTEGAIPTLSFGFRLQRPTWFARFVATALFPEDVGDYATGRETVLLPGVSVGMPL